MLEMADEEMQTQQAACHDKKVQTMPDLEYQERKRKLQCQLQELDHRKGMLDAQRDELEDVQNEIKKD